MPPEHLIFDPADQSVDKSSFRSSPSECAIAETGIQETSPGSRIVHGARMPTVTMSEEPPLSKTGREKLACLLADLLGFPSTVSQPEATTHKLNLYESMSPALGNELNLAPAVPLQESQQEKRAVIYENCLKCQGEHCQPPPRAPPARRCHNRNVSALKTSPIWLHVKKSQEHPANEEFQYQALNESSQRVDGQCQYKEMNGPTVSSEGKRPPPADGKPSNPQPLSFFPLHLFPVLFLLLLSMKSSFFPAYFL